MTATVNESMRNGVNTTFEAKLQPLKISMDAAHSNVDQIAVTAYKTGSDLRTLSVMLSASSSDTFVDQLSTLHEITRHQQHEVANFTTAKAGYDTEKQRLNDLLAAQHRQKTDLETRKKQIEGWAATNFPNRGSTKILFQKVRNPCLRSVGTIPQNIAARQ